MDAVLKAGQVASVKIKNLVSSKVYLSLYQEWLNSGKTGSFDDFIATLRPEVDLDDLRALIKAELAKSTATDTKSNTNPVSDSKTETPSEDTSKTTPSGGATNTPNPTPVTPNPSENTGGGSAANTETDNSGVSNDALADILKTLGGTDGE